MIKLTEDQEKLLKKDFPSEALSVDNSRGFPLTSIKAAYVIERLNDVFGIGGWSYDFSDFEEIQGEITTVVTLFIHSQDNEHLAIKQAGGKRIIKTNITDARKSAVTDGLTKCASILGIGHNIFKGKVKVGDEKPPEERTEEEIF